jgi:hypothetical protein
MSTVGALAQEDCGRRLRRASLVRRPAPRAVFEAKSEGAEHGPQPPTGGAVSQVGAVRPGSSRETI